MRLGSFKTVYVIPLGLAIACCLAIAGCRALETPDSDGWARFDTLSGRGPVASIAFSPDGQIASTHTSLYPSDERPSPVFAGGYLAVWRNAHFLRLLESSMLVDGLTLHQVRFRPDGKQCLAAVNKGVVAWDLEKSQLIQTPPTYVHALSPDGRLSVRLESDESYECLLVEDLLTGKLIAKISLPDSHLYGRAFSLDHKLLAISNDDIGDSNKFIIWNLETGTQQCSFAPPINSRPTDFSQDGKHIATYSNDNVVRIWNTANGSLEKSFELGEKPIRAVGFSPDRRFLAVAYERETYEQTGGVILFDVNTGKQETEMLEETAWGVTAVAFSPDGEFLATGNSDGESNSGGFRNCGNRSP